MKQSFVTADPARFELALRRFDDENSQDPNREQSNGEQLPRELVYSHWLSEWVLRLCPDASEALRLAARAAHLRRWSIARNSYEMTRPGYLRWRADLKKFHAQRAGDILQEIGYPDETIERVRGLISKSLFPRDPESRVLEDALCLLFLERQFDELAEKSTDEKTINALQKTWAKMTPKAQSIALSLPYSPREKSFLERAGILTGRQADSL